MSPLDFQSGMRHIFLLMASMSLLAACSVPVKKSDDAGMLLTEHPLVGKIWDVNAGRFVGKPDLAKAIFKSDYLLLGETHDNIKHHQGQAWAIAQLSDKPSGAVSFEMISEQQGRVIAGKQYDSVESLIAGLNHIKTSWDYAQLYQPVFAQTIKAGYAVLPANFDREKILLFARKGEAELPPEIKTLLDENALPAEQVAASRKEIEGSHCGMINEEMTAAMMLIQRAKDIKMMQAVLSKKASAVGVLVAGSGHVRKDRGVPFYLQRYASGKNILTVAWAEVQPDFVDAKSYAEHWGSQQLPFDFVWFTPRVDRPDPCEQFRQHMKNKHADEK